MGPALLAMASSTAFRPAATVNAGLPSNPRYGIFRRKRSPGGPGAVPPLRRCPWSGARPSSTAGMNLRRNGSANDGVFELQAAAPRQGRYPEERPRQTGRPHPVWFLVPVMSLGIPRNGLTVRDRRRMGFAFAAEPILRHRLQNEPQVQLARAHDDGLVGDWFGARRPGRGPRMMQSLNRLGQLLFVAAAHGFNGQPHHRWRPLRRA